MNTHLTISKVHNLETRTEPYDVWDSKMPKLIVRVYTTGRKSYAVVFGRSKRHTLGSTEILTPNTAREMAQEFLTDILRGIDPKEKKRKANMKDFAQFLKTDYGPWVLTHRKSGKATLSRLKNQFNAISNTNLDKINPFQIEKWRATRLKAGINPATANRDVTSLKAALNKAVEWGHIISNPIRTVKPLRVDNGNRVRFLSPDEEKSLLEAIVGRTTKIKTERESANQWRAQRNHPLFPDLNRIRFADHLEPMILLTINTGLRRGELFNLKWDNIDFTRRDLTVTGETAKSASTRHIPLNQTAFSVLKDWKKQSPKSALVFPSKDDSPFTDIKKPWKHLLSKAKIDDFRWHDLRHHFASMLVMQRVPLNTVRELLGHSNLDMTIRYAHLCPDHKARAISVLDNLPTGVSDTKEASTKIHRLSR